MVTGTAALGNILWCNGDSKLRGGSNKTTGGKERNNCFNAYLLGAQEL